MRLSLFHIADTRSVKTVIDKPRNDYRDNNIDITIRKRVYPETDRSIGKK